MSRHETPASIYPLEKQKKKNKKRSVSGNTEVHEQCECNPQKILKDSADSCVITALMNIDSLLLLLWLTLSSWHGKKEALHILTVHLPHIPMFSAVQAQLPPKCYNVIIYIYTHWHFERQLLHSLWSVVDSHVFVFTAQVVWYVPLSCDATVALDGWCNVAHVHGIYSACPSGEESVDNVWLPIGSLENWTSHPATRNVVRFYQNWTAGASWL